MDDIVCSVGLSALQCATRVSYGVCNCILILCNSFPSHTIGLHTDFAHLRAVARHRWHLCNPLSMCMHRCCSCRGRHRQLQRRDPGLQCTAAITNKLGWLSANWQTVCRHTRIAELQSSTRQKSMFKSPCSKVQSTCSTWYGISCTSQAAASHPVQ